MPSSSCSITLEIEHDADYRFLNALRMTNGFHAGHPAHISLVNRLQLFWACDSDSTSITALEKQLQAVTSSMSPFEFQYNEMDLREPFGRGRGCVAVTVRPITDLRIVIVHVEAM